MDDLIHLNRFRKRMLLVFSDLVKMHGFLEELAEVPDQDHIDALATALSSFNGSVEGLRTTLEKLLHEIAGIEDEEIDVDVTDDGSIL